MAIPQRPLVMTLPTESSKLRLGDLKLFEPGGFSIAGFEAFMLRYGNWTVAELDDLEAGEMQTVVADIKAKLQDGAVPKANGARSRAGRAAKATPASPAGPE